MALNKPGLMLAIPTIGMHSSHFTQSKDRLAIPTNFTWSQYYINKREVGRARNTFAWKAIQEKVRYLFFWDEDVIPPMFGLKSLLFQMENHPEWTLATGIYTTKGYPPEPLTYSAWGVGPCYDWKVGEVFPIVFSGLGFTLIRVADLERLRDKVEQVEDRDPWTNAPISVPRFFRTTDEVQVSDKQIEHLGSTEDAPFYHLLEDNDLIAAADANVLCAHYDSLNDRIFTVPQEFGLCKKPDAWNHTPLVCNLGAGGEDSPYEVKVDLRGGPHIDYRCDVRRLPDDWDNRFDQVKAHHVLEHFDYEDSQDIVKEWARIVKPGGTLTVETPDLQEVAERIAADGEMDPHRQGQIFGDQGSEYWEQPAYGGEYHGRFLDYGKANNHHAAGFTAKYLAKLFEKAGLAEVLAERGGFSVACRGTKPQEASSWQTSCMTGAETSSPLDLSIGVPAEAPTLSASA